MWHCTCLAKIINGGSKLKSQKRFEMPKHLAQSYRSWRKAVRLVGVIFMTSLILLIIVGLTGHTEAAFAVGLASEKKAESSSVSYSVDSQAIFTTYMPLVMR